MEWTPNDLIQLGPVAAITILMIVMHFRDKARAEKRWMDRCHDTENRILAEKKSSDDRLIQVIELERQSREKRADVAERQATSFERLAAQIQASLEMLRNGHGK